MKYVKKVHVVLTALLLVAAVCLGIRLFTDRGDRLYDFIFGRSVIQFATLTVFAVTAVLLVRRARDYVGKRRVLQACEQNENAWKKQTATPFGRYLNRLRNLLAADQKRAALSCADKYVQDEQDHLRKDFELVDFLVCSLPALGLLGTMLGLSQGLFSAFSKGSIGPEATQQFVQSIGVALDTTVLAMLCALAAGTAGWLIRRHEKNLVVRQDGLARTLFALDGAADELEDAARTTGQKQVQQAIASITEQVSRTLSGIVVDVTDPFRQAVETVATQCGQAVRDAVTSVFDEQRQSSEIVVHRLETLLGGVSERGREQLHAAVEKLAAEQNRNQQDMMERIGSRFDETLTAMGERYETTARKALEIMLKQQRVHEEKMVEQFGERLDGSMQTVGERLSEYGQTMTAAVAREMKSVNETLENVLPGEVIIRYDRRNHTADAAEFMEVSHVA